MAPPQFKVIIAGGGIAGLALGVMLERAGIDYIILEAHDEVRPLGAVVYLGPSLMRVMEQLGLLDDLIRHSNFMTGVTLLDHNLTKICRLNVDFSRDRYGYDTLTIVRPKLYDILLSRIPAYKILFNKRVTSSAQNHDGVKVRCEDGISYSGDILVAADGGASPIRESFYEEIKKRSKKVPHPSDYARPKLDQRCIVGVTKPLDVRQYPTLLSKECELVLVMPKESNCMIWFVPMTEHRFGWGVTSPLPAMSDSTESEKDNRGSRPSVESSDIPGSPKVMNRTAPSFSTMSITSYSPPASASPSPVSSPGIYQYDHFQPSQRQQPHPPLQHSASLKKRQSFGRLSKTSSSSSSGSQSIFQKYPAVLQSIHGSEVGSSRGSLSGFTGSDLPSDRVWRKLDEQYTIEESIREQTSPFGGVFGDFVDATAKNMISMAVVEEKFYHTWHFGRTVLLGDACHKLLPSSGHGTSQAVLDAISLVSLLVDLPSNSPTDIDALFRVHYERRGPAAKEAVVASQQQDQLLFNRKLSGKIIRKMASNWIGDWVQVKMGDRLFDSRPMLHFMKPVPDRGSYRNRDNTVPLLKDKRFEAARRKSISSGEIGRHSSEEGFEGFTEKQEKKSKKKNKGGVFDSSPFSSSMPSIIGASPSGYIPAVPALPPMHRRMSSMMDIEGTLIPAVPRQHRQEQEVIGLHNSHWHLYQDYSFPNSNSHSNNHH
ncbi:hypothetical protein CPB97_005683 [Podila verticillata]|nr:hypothetical protein CPB97_005683 [Podila verticillata]